MKLKAHTVTLMNSRGASNKTRIETVTCCLRYGVCHSIQEAHPIKQGLKLKESSVANPVPKNSRGASNKTRIET